MDYPKNIVILLIFLNLGTYVLSVTVTVQPSQYYITEGKTATLLCTYTLGQDETVDVIEWYRTRDSKQKILKVTYSGNTQVERWYLDFSVNDPSSKPGRGSFLGTLGGNSATIQINNIVAADDAEYSCFVEATNAPPVGPTSFNTDEQPLHLYLNILPAKPMFTVDRTESQEGLVDLFPDATVNMTCTGNVGRPSGRLRWEQSYGTSDIWERTLRETSYKIIANNSDQTAVVQIEYSKKFILSDDSTKIRCLADREAYGLSDITYSTVIQFSVKEGKPVANESIKITATNMESKQGTDYEEGEHVQLMCSFGDAYPTPAIKWFKGDEELGTNIILDLGVVTKENAGTYDCEATNEIMGIQHTARQSITITIAPALGGIAAGGIAGIVIGVVVVIGIVIGVLVYVFVFSKRRKATSRKDTENGTYDPSKADNSNDQTRSDFGDSKENEYDNPVMKGKDGVDSDEKNEMRYADLDLRMRDEDKYGNTSPEKPKRSESPVEYADIKKTEKPQGTSGTSV